jgi:signal transduction histidine kinase
VQLASIAASRLEELIRRISGFVHLLVVIEVSVNGFNQIIETNGFGIYLLIFYLAIASLTLLSLWFGRGKVIPLAYSSTVLVIVLLNPISNIEEFDFGANGRPWIWWAIGFAAILFAVHTKTWLWVTYLAALSASWFAVELVLFGEQRIFQATLDAAYVVVYCFAVMALVSLVRDGAREVDVANGEAIRSALQQARAEAVGRERQRVDALVHDQVLHTLLLAARAQAPDEKAAAAESASQAIASLERAKSDQDKSEVVTTAGLFRAIEDAALKLDTRVSVEISGASSAALRPEIAQAMTEATLQALDNSIQHSRASEIRLELTSDKSGVRFIVEDNGVGFRPERVSKDRIGINTSIRFRMSSIGGFAEITSEPGKGAKVILGWPND